MTEFEILNSDPRYVYKGARGTAEISLRSELLSHRVVPIVDKICMETAVNFYMSMKYLCASDGPITVPIYTYGGEVIAGKAIYDMMQGCKNEVHTFCIGIAASMGATLLAAGTKGHRYILPHSEVMIHEVLVNSGVSGSATSITKFSQSINKTRDMMNAILAKHTGRTIEEINAATAFDNFMDAAQAVEFGICDKIVENIF